MDAVALLQAMLEIPSHSGREEALSRYLVETMDSLGFRAYRDEAGNAAGEIGDSGPLIIFLGHMDTVDGWIPVKIEGDQLWGRGAVDAKGPLAAAIVAAAELPRHLGKRVVVVGAVEEECATSKGARALLGRYRPDACIIGEPSGWANITLGYRGRLLVHYRFEQDAGHPAGLRRAVAEGAVAFWQVCRALADRYNAGRTGAFNRLDTSLRRIFTTSDGLRDQVEMLVGFRLPLGFPTADLQAELEAGASGASLSFTGGEVAYRAEKSTPLVRAFLPAIRAMGGEPRFKVKTGTSDMNVVGPVWGCPIVAYGPGDSRLDHTPHERIDLAEYRRAISILRSVFINL